MKRIYLKSVLKCDSFDVAICIKIPFLRVLVTTEPGRSLLQFVTTNCLTGLFCEIDLIKRIVAVDVITNGECTARNADRFQ